jgi:anti-anti-sigma regulatory factor
MELNVIHHESPHAAVIQVNGRLDGTSFEKLVQRAGELFATGPGEIILDMTNCDFMSSAGLMSLHSVALIVRGELPLNTEHGWSAFRHMDMDKSESSPAKLKIVGANDKIRQTLEMTGMASEFDLFHDIELALKAIG